MKDLAPLIEKSQKMLEGMGGIDGISNLMGKMGPLMNMMGSTWPPAATMNTDVVLTAGQNHKNSALLMNLTGTTIAATLLTIPG